MPEPGLVFKFGTNFKSLGNERCQNSFLRNESFKLVEKIHKVANIFTAFDGKFSFDAVSVHGSLVFTMENCIFWFIEPIAPEIGYLTKSDSSGNQP